MNNFRIHEYANIFISEVGSTIVQFFFHSTEISAWYNQTSSSSSLLCFSIKECDSIVQNIQIDQCMHYIKNNNVTKLKADCDRVQRPC